MYTYKAGAIIRDRLRDIASSSSRPRWYPQLVHTLYVNLYRLLVNLNPAGHSGRLEISLHV